MKYIIPLLISLYVFSALDCIASTRIKRRTSAAETPLQFELSGVDKAYVHGPHCIDGRTF